MAVEELNQEKDPNSSFDIQFRFLYQATQKFKAFNWMIFPGNSIDGTFGQSILLRHFWCKGGGGNLRPKSLALHHNEHRLI